MQMFVKKFSVDSERIIIADKSHYDVQYLLKKCSTLITDYSSIFMDVVYIQKPVLFYQFDEQKFRQGQYNSGYFDYHNNQYSLWADTEKDLLDWSTRNHQFSKYVKDLIRDDMNRAN